MYKLNEMINKIKLTLTHLLILRYIKEKKKKKKKILNISIKFYFPINKINPPIPPLLQSTRPSAQAYVLI